MVVPAALLPIFEHKEKNEQQRHKTETEFWRNHMHRAATYAHLLC